MTSSVRAATGTVPFKVGTLPFGAVQWGVETILKNGFDKAAGLSVENVPLASSEAARVSFLSGSVDTIVSDLLFAARLRAEGKKVKFLPRFTAEGALMVSAASPIKGLADLKGKSIGVAGGAIDKNWLVMQATAKKQAGLDLSKDARPVFGAPPLLAAKVESGELDAGLLYWPYCARLLAKGYRQVAGVEEMASTLGAKGKVAFTGYLFNEGADPKVLEGYSRAAHQADALLADKPEAWTAIKPIMKAPDDATFEALKTAYLGGLIRKPREQEIADAQALFAILATIGGAALIGGAQSLPESLYVDQAIYG